MADSIVLQLIVRAQNAATGVLNQVDAQIKNISGNARVMADSLAKSGVALAAVGGAISAPFLLGIKAAGGFQQEMANVRAIMTDLTDEQFEQMNVAAKRLGETTKFTAAESASSLKYLAMAGLSAEQALTALPATLDLAAAGEINLGDAADIATNVVAGMRLKVSDLADVVDVLAVGAANANTDVSQLGQGLKTVGPAAAASGESVRGIVSILGALANNAIKGAEGGTAVRNMLIRLQSDNPKVVKTLRELNVSVKDSSGKFRGLKTILRELGEANLDTSAAAKIFGAKTAVAALAAANATTDIDRLGEALTKSAGAAKEMAKAKLATFFGSITKLTSAIGGLLISIGNKFLPMVTAAVKGLTTIVRWVVKIHDALGPVSTVIDTVAIAFGGLLVTLGAVGIAWGLMIKPLLLMKTELLQLGIAKAFAAAPAAAVNATTLAAGETAAATATTGLSLSMATLLPILGTMALALGALAGAYKIAELVGVMIDHVKMIRERTKAEKEYIDQAAKYEQYADVQIASMGQIKTATHEQNQAYADSLQGAIDYWKKIMMSQDAAGKSSKETRDKLNELIGAMGDLHRADPSVTFDTLTASQGETKKATDEVTGAVENLNEALSKTGDAGKSAQLALDVELAELKLAWKQGYITEQEFNTKSLEAKKYYWEQRVSARQAALSAMQDSSSDEYKQATLELTEAEVNLIEVEGELAKKISATGDAMADTSQKEAALKTSYESMLITLKLSLARGEMTEQQFRDRRSKLERENWQNILNIRKAALVEVGKTYGTESEKYKQALLKVKQAELSLIGTTQNMGGAMATAANKGEEGARVSAQAWQALADQVGMTVSQLKNAIGEISGEIDAASNKIAGLASREFGAGVTKEGQKYSYAGNVDYSGTLSTALAGSTSDLQAQLDRWSKLGNQQISGGWFDDAILNYKKMAGLLNELQMAKQTGNITQNLKDNLTPADLKTLQDSIKANTQSNESNTQVQTDHALALDDNTASITNSTNSSNLSSEEMRQLQLKLEVNTKKLEISKNRQQSEGVTKDNLAQEAMLLEEQKAIKEQMGASNTVLQALAKQIQRLYAQMQAMGRKEAVGYAIGGSVPGVGNKDTVPAMLTPGEFVIKKSVVESLGTNFFSLLNRGVRLPAIKFGIPHFASGGEVQSSSNKMVTLDFNIGGESHQGSFDEDVASKLVQTLQQASMVST